MADNEEPIYRPEFDAFRSEIRGDMRDLRDGMIKADTRQDTMERRTASLETQIAQGFESTRADIQSLRSIRTWVIGGVAAGGSAVGAAIWHAILTGLHP